MRTALLTAALVAAPLFANPTRLLATDYAAGPTYGVSTFDVYAEKNLLRAIGYLDRARRYHRPTEAAFARHALDHAAQNVCRTPARYLIHQAIEEIDRFCRYGHPANLQRATRLTHRALDIERSYHASRPAVSPTVPYGWSSPRSSYQYAAPFGYGQQVPQPGHFPGGFSAKTGRLTLRTFDSWVH